MSKHLLLSIGVVLLIGSLATPGCGLWRKETVVTMAQVPPPVRNTLEKTMAGSTIKKIEKIESGGKVTYEVEYRRDGKDHEAHFAEDGRLVKGD